MDEPCRFVGNMIRREVGNATTGTKNRQIEYRYNYQDQLTSVSQNGQLVAEYGYDTNRQRVYATTYVTPYQSEKYYTWSGWQIIAESDTQGGENIVRDVYSGNQKVAMVRKGANGTEAMYYFINNGQGTPVMIVNEAGAVVSRITMDEWGNINPVEHANLNEINYTGKKYDPATGLYYFNQRYYDPRIGRFTRLRLREELALPVRTGLVRDERREQGQTNTIGDPAGQAFNPYMYAGNNPLIIKFGGSPGKYTDRREGLSGGNRWDPDGEWFFSALLSCFGPLGTMVGAAIDGGVAASAVNIGSQLVSNGFSVSQINWNSVGQSFTSAALGSVSGGIAGINLGTGFWNELGANALKTGLGNVVQGVAQGDMRLGDRFLSGAQQGAADFIAARAVQGVQMSFGKEYMETYDSIKSQVAAMNPLEGVIVAKEINVLGFPVEHWQVVYNTVKGGVENIGSIGAPSGLIQGIATNCGLMPAVYGSDSNLISAPLRIVRKITRFDINQGQRAADQGYNLLFNNCVHISDLQH